MGRKLRHLLMFLLIILKEPNMPEADCSCAPSSRCYCVNMGLTSVPQNLPTSIEYLLHLDDNNITKIQPGAFANLLRLELLFLASNQITMIQPGAFVHLPRLRVLSLPYNQLTMIHAYTFANLPQLVRLDLKDNQIAKIQDGTFANLTQLKLLLLQRNLITMIQSDLLANLINLKTLRLSYNEITMIQEAGIALIGAVILTIWGKKRTKNPPSGSISNIAWDNVAKSATVVTSGHDQTGQGQSQANTQPLNVENLPHNVLAALKPNPMYTVVPKDQTSSAMASGHDQNGQGQGQSQAINESNRNTRVRAMTSEHDHPYEDIDQNNQTGHGQSQAITEFNTNTTATVMTIANDHQYEDIDQQHNQTGQGQSQAITGSNTETTAIVEDSDHVFSGNNVSS
uniref:LRRNT domain-containing protein n=1 Tax=Branchiostoma floridae TaxID=7739 RepID=C3ZZE5_BRAFL|eukprot:XP_002586070.1 hypothetical protein BRAFLDRAFT_108255 [Branchiostoma floridae]